MVNQPLRVGGLASGLDVEGLIAQIMAVRRRPITQMEARKTTQRARGSAIGDVRNRVTNLLAQAQTLSNAANLNGRKATVNTPAGQTAQVSVSAGTTAATGAFTVRTINLATSTTRTAASGIGQAVTQNVALAAAGFATTVTPGTFTVNGATVTIDASTVLSDGANLPGANTIIAKISDATGGAVTASVVNDAYGRANLLRLDSAGAIQLGSGGDTSNFLTAALLLASPGTTQRTSTQPVAGTLAAQPLQSARLAVAPAASGSFKINGVELTYDATNDTLNGVLTRINASQAGVTATYDPVADKVTLTAKTTGSTSIAIEDVTGNLLTALGLVGGTQTLGESAEYSINGGATQYSATNTIANALPGVTITLLQESATAVGVDVTADADATVAKVKAFVAQYNSTYAFIKDQAGLNTLNQKNPLFGEASINVIANALRSSLTNPALGLTGAGYTTAAELGISFGKFSAEGGASNTLELDEAKLRAALAANPARVNEVIAGFGTQATLEPAGTGSVASITGTPTALAKAGKFSIETQAGGGVISTFTPDDGSAVVTKSTTFVAGGTDTTLIPGVTITFAGALTVGTDTITGSVPKQGFAKRMEYYLDPVSRTGGILDNLSTQSKDAVADIDEQIARLETRLDMQEQTLNAKFTAMELTLRRLQQQQATLTSAIGTFSSLQGR